MKKLLIILFLALTPQGILSAEIQSTIDDYPASFYHLKQNWSRPFIGTIEFIRLPAPSKETTVNFVLKVPQDSPWQDEYPWTIRLDYRKWQTTVISDTIFIWPGPHRASDIFNGSITFVPRVSGLCGITIYRDIESALLTRYDIIPGLTFSWCLNEVGELLYLGNAQFKNVNLNPLRIHYFEVDSIYLSGEELPNDLYNQEILIKPIPIIGDTFSVKYNLIATTDLPFGVDLLINSRGLRLIDFPRELSKPHYTGDTLQIEIVATPFGISTGHKIHLQFWKEYGIKSAEDMQDIFCQFQFDERGELLFIHNQPFSVAGKYIPKSRPDRVRKVEEIVIIHKSGIIERR